MEKEEPGLGSLVLFAFAMGVHFVVNDFGLREDHKGAYERAGCRVLAAVAFATWVVRRRFEASGAALAVPFASLAGGVVMNVLNKKLPKGRESRFWAFVLGGPVRRRLAGGILGSLSRVT
jgi:hypothetical protein